MSDKTQRTAVATYYDLAAPTTVHGGSPRRPILRCESTGILEQYVKLLEKEQELQGKKEKTKRLRAKHRLSLRIREIENEETCDKNVKTAASDARKRILKSRNDLLTKTWDASELHAQIEMLDLSFTEQSNSLPSTPRIHTRLNSFREPSSKQRKNTRPVSETLQKRRNAAEIKRLNRLRQLSDLEKDCQRAQLIIDKMKSLSTDSGTS